jgi:hypothetical protein
MTPSLPTFFIASARKRPISESPLAEMVPTCAISSFEVTFLEFFLRSSMTAAEIDAAFEVHRVHAGGDRLGAFLDDGGGEHGCSGGAVAGNVGGLRGDLAHHLRAHVLEFVLELDFLGDGDAVLGDARRAEALVEHDVAALGTERHLHRIIEDVDPAQHLVARFDREFDFLGSHSVVSEMMS